MWKGKIYLYSYNTQLDSHDCVALLPDGTLILSLTHESNLRVPINFTKKTSKTIGFTKYGLQRFILILIVLFKNT